MAHLTTKELTALSDQLNFEKVLYCKYQTALENCQEGDLRSAYQQCVQRHRDNYDCLLKHLS
ncbi:spore coat protein [Pseudoflavonifractor sp. 524-17]|uniref:spore coat protein n=1 Tax=Pseudoflavonifractor sp. 524-17 TaxID=2304577 RepID=UPI0013796A44|nr:spore coat protein [Pseudoflavonifractor sp. 524-17]NCE64260.1 spore coat protein [Pseudoflavonifractor sp. 524-17]